MVTDREQLAAVLEALALIEQRVKNLELAVFGETDPIKLQARAFEAKVAEKRRRRK